MNLVDHDSERLSPGTSFSRKRYVRKSLREGKGKGRISIRGGVGGLPVNKETGRITRANGERFRKEKERERDFEERSAQSMGIEPSNP